MTVRVCECPCGGLRDRVCECPCGGLRDCPCV